MGEKASDSRPEKKTEGLYARKLTSVIDEVRSDLAELESETPKPGMAAPPDQDMVKLQKRKRTEMREKRKAATTTAISAEIKRLRRRGVSLSFALGRVRDKFEGSITSEVDVVLGRFESLFSSSVIPVRQERTAIENLFSSRSTHEFTSGEFSGFVRDVYDQPDDIVSEETKARIEKRFGIPRNITTGGQLLKATAFRSANGELAHHSPSTALRIQAGMRSYVNHNGEAIVSVSDEEASPFVLYRKGLQSWNGEMAAKAINHCLIRLSVSRHFDHMTGLFGETRESDGTQFTAVVERANRFARLLIGYREPNHLFQDRDVENLGSALNALVNPRNRSTGENMADLRRLGVIVDGDFNWERLGEIGAFLRRNRYFRAQATKDAAAPYFLLSQHVQTLETHNGTRKQRPSIYHATSAKGESGRTVKRQRWIGSLSRVNLQGSRQHDQRRFPHTLKLSPSDAAEDRKARQVTREAFPRVRGFAAIPVNPFRNCRQKTDCR